MWVRRKFLILQKMTVLYNIACYMEREARYYIEVILRECKLRDQGAGVIELRKALSVLIDISDELGHNPHIGNIY